MIKNRIKKIAFGITTTVIFIIILFSLTLLPNLKKREDKTVVPPDLINKSNQYRITISSPTATTPLVPGMPQEFAIDTSPSIDPSLVKIKLFSASPSEAKPTTPVSIKTSPANSTQIKTVTEGPITAMTQYLLVVSYKETVVASQTYLSLSPVPTMVPNNNKTLREFLPYKTNNYSLEYVEEKNIYVMHFIYNPSGIPLGEQFETAKNDTNNFIESKGITLSSIVIEYLFK